MVSRRNTEPRLIRPLPFGLVPGDREVPLDYLSRLSFRNGRDGLRRIATDFGIALHPLLRGDTALIEQVARLGSADPSLLEGSAFKATGERQRTIYQGQVLHHTMTSFNGIRFCAACLAEDIERGTGRVESRPWRRAEWLLPDLATCPNHSLALTKLDPSVAPDRKILDFSACVRGILPRLAEEIQQAESRSVTLIESHVLRRLAGKKAGDRGEAWLDEFPLYAVIRMCEVVGAVALEGVDATAWRARDAKSRERQAAGFPVVVGGPSAFREFLSDFVRLDLDPRAQRGPQAFFGHVYKWLASPHRDPAYDPLRWILRDFCVDTMPIGAGEAPPFGSPLPARLLHSVRSASLEFAIPQVWLRKILFAKGVVGPDQGHLLDNRVMFSAPAHEPFLRDLAAALTQEKAARHLGLALGLVKSLTDDGVLVPWLGIREESSKYHFRAADLDAFVDSLSAKRSAAFDNHPSLHDIPAAAKRACRSQSEIVRLLLSGKLGKVGRRDGASGYMSVLVDPAEVRTKSRAPVDQGISVPDARDETGITYYVLRAMARQGLVRSRLGKSTVTGSAQTFLDRDDLAEFVKRYVLLAEIACGLSVSCKMVKNRLADVGVEPTAFSKHVGSVFYERKFLPPLQKLSLNAKRRVRT